MKLRCVPRRKPARHPNQTRNPVSMQDAAIEDR